YAIFTQDGNKYYIYPVSSMFPNIINIFQDENIEKLISKNSQYLKNFLNGNKCNNCRNINDYLSANGNNQGVISIKNEIINIGNIQDLIEKHSLIAQTIINYKLKTDELKRKTIKRPTIKSSGPARNKNFFSPKRQCYLLYLTIFNEIL